MIKIIYKADPEGGKLTMRPRATRGMPRRGRTSCVRRFLCWRRRWQTR